MKRDILKNLVKAALTFSLIAGVVFAQYTKGNTVIAWSKYKFKPVSEVDGWEPGDRRESIEAFHTARNAKARLLLSSLFLTHYWTGHVTDVMQVNEFKSMDDATAYSGSQAPLNKRTWADEEERKAATSAYGKYFQSYHEDVHLFENRVKLEKKKKKSKDNPNTVVAVMNRYWKPLSQVEGGSAEEREKMMQKYHKEVTMKNDKKISKRTVTHLWTGSLSNGYYPITTITEFASMADADDLQYEPKIFDEAFTDEEKEAYNKYWAPASHEDIGLFWNQAYTNKNK
jgi:hypothetical protein